MGSGAQKTHLFNLHLPRMKIKIAEHKTKKTFSTANTKIQTKLTQFPILIGNATGLSQQQVRDRLRAPTKEERKKRDVKVCMNSVRIASFTSACEDQSIYLDWEKEENGSVAMSKARPQKIRALHLAASQRFRDTLLNRYHKHVGIQTDAVTVFARKYSGSVARGLIVDVENKTMEFDSTFFKLDEVTDGTAPGLSKMFKESTKLVENLGLSVAAHSVDNEQSGVKGFYISCIAEESDQGYETGEDSDVSTDVSECVFREKARRALWDCDASDFKKMTADDIRQLLENTEDPFCELVRCICHILNLAFDAGFEASKTANNIVSACNEVAVLLHKSPETRADFRKLQDAAKPGQKHTGLLLLRNKTRWTSSCNCVKGNVDWFDEIEVLEEYEGSKLKKRNFRECEVRILNDYFTEFKQTIEWCQRGNEICSITIPVLCHWIELFKKMPRPFGCFGQAAAAKLEGYLEKVCEGNHHRLLTLVDPRFGAELLDRYNVDYSDVEFKGKSICVTQTVLPTMSILEKIQSKVTKTKYSKFINKFPSNPGVMTPIQMFINHHGFEQTLEFEELLVACPAIGYMERKNRSIKEKSRCRPSLDVKLLESYVIQDDCKSRMALYEAILEEEWDSLKLETVVPEESSDAKKRRLELAEKLKAKKAAKSTD